MSYSVELTDRASAALSRLPVDLIICVNVNLLRLADDPVRLGRKAGFPHRATGQTFEFWCDGNCFVTVFWHFVPGTNQIRVFDLATRRVH